LDRESNVMTKDCVEPTLSLTKEFSTHTILSLQSLLPWERLHSLLKTAPRGPESPLAAFDRERPRWIKMLEDTPTREQGQAIASIWDNFSEKSIYPPDIMMVPMLEEVTRTLPNMSPKSLRQIMISMSYLAVDPGPVILEQLAALVAERSPKFDNDSRIYAIHALTVMDALQEHKHGKSRVPLVEAYKVLLNGVKLVNVIKGGHIAILRDGTKWFGCGFSLERVSEDDCSSNFERNVDELFCNVSGDAKSLHSHIVKETGHRIDLTHEFRGRKFHTECDGNTHIVMGTNGSPSHMNGQTILQTGLLRPLLEEPLVRVSQIVFNQKRNYPEYWEQFLHQIGSYPGKTCLFLNGHESPEFHMIGHIDRFAL